MVLFLGLFIVWVILNGKVTVEICLFGVAIAGVLTWFSRKFLQDGNRKGRSVRYYLLLVLYGFFMIGEIVKANAAVLKLAFARRLNFQPALVSFASPLKDEGLQTILANSITITPGTITVLLQEGQFIVHCLDKDFGKGIDKSGMVKLLQKIELEKEGQHGTVE